MRGKTPHRQYREKIKAAGIAVFTVACLLVSMDAAWAQSLASGGAKVARPVAESTFQSGENTIRSALSPGRRIVPDVTDDPKAVQSSSRHEPPDEIRTAAIIPRVPSDKLRPSGAIHDGSVLGTIPIRVSALAVSPRWKAIMAAEPGRLFTEPCSPQLPRCNTSLRRAFDRMMPAQGSVPNLDLVKMVDRTVNHLIRYQIDLATYGVDDYWATPEETAARGVGDCEDFVIVKFGMLLALGVSPDSMRVLVVKDLIRNIGHALLSVEIQGETYILDSNTDAVTLEAETAGFQPLYSIGANGAWIHGVRRAPIYQVATTGTRAAQ
jgi:predicted transglutaminase-like cysteine proteinase